MNRIRFLLVITILVLLGGLVGSRPMIVRGASFLVDSNADDTDAHDANPGDCACADSHAACTLRAAIEEANACSGADTITFNDPMTITLSATVGALPTITETLTIDASAVWNSTKDRPGVVIDGNGMDENGLHLAADACEVYGLYIRGFGPSAIRVISANNQIGGTGTGQRNVLSGNATHGLWLDTLSAQLNQVQNNYIGTAPDGVTAQGNQMGVGISEGASYNTIGGSTTAQGNLISGNSMHGVYFSGMGNNGNGLGGNTIGLDVGRTLPLPNGEDGVNVERATDTYIGGGSALAANLIGENGRHGVFLGAAVSGVTTVEDNTITANDQHGVVIEGAGCAIVGNVIATNQQYGIWVSGAGATGNNFTMNSIYYNTWGGIKLDSGANYGRTAPTVTIAAPTWASGTVAGCPNCYVEVFSDSYDQGEIYHGGVLADANGNWSYTGPLTGPRVTATVTDAGGNTSEFSAPSVVKNWLKVFLPLVRKGP